ncbi:MAG: SAM-dependent methyltransferase [Blautia sp.]|nr:SAM-dependent methyltransferase [Blautia sp.]
MKTYQITDFCHNMVLSHIQKGDFCIDATVGNGYDTEFLCHAAGPEGFVLGLDLQESAVLHTRKRLEQNCPGYSFLLVQDSHENLLARVNGSRIPGFPEGAACIMFNLGYLPGGDHSFSTKKESTLKGLSDSLLLLKKNGILSICIYSGGDTGFEEKDAVLSWLKELDSRKYLVLLTQYYNRPNNPPIPAFVIRMT